MCQEKKGAITNIEDRVDASIWRLENYIKKNKKRLIRVTSNSRDNIKIFKKDNSKEKKIGRKTNLSIFPATN